MMNKYGAIGEFILTLFLGGYCWATAFLDEKYIYMVLFFSIAVICFVAKVIAQDICDAIIENNGYNRRVDIELCKILHALTSRAIRSETVRRSDED